MPCRVVAALGMVGLIAVLVSLAYASPPDQSWLAGFYDDADCDDAVITVSSATAVVEAGPLVPTRQIRIVFLDLSAPHEAPLSIVSRLLPSRAPPII